MAALTNLVVPAKAVHTATVIFIHGLGDSGAGWKPIAEMLSNQLPHVKWILPNAPVMMVDFAGGRCPSWFNIRSINLEDPNEDEAGIQASARAINSFVKAEVDAGIDSRRIIVGGFSQGAALSLFTGLTATERQIGGIACLSGWLPLSKKITALIPDHGPATPVFMAHGHDDMVVPYQAGLKSYTYLTQTLADKKLPTATLDTWTAQQKGQKAGPGVIFRAYKNLGHSSDPRELRDLVQWMNAVIPEKLV